ncbi:MAG: GGDEF domain-containing protein [Clostridia bacterium]|nr:GGDEF domain-containing protein [Clostridia bacterium]
MNNPINCILAIFLITFLFLLCIATVLIIIKILKTQNDYSFYFKNGSRLYNLAFKDDLTDLFNRNAYIRDLAKIKRNKLKSLWFSIFDIDDFKTINDTKGHLYGDEVLILAANRLSEIFCEKKHTIYRIGGDEFLVISKDIAENELIDLLLKLKKAELKN